MHPVESECFFVSRGSQGPVVAETCPGISRVHFCKKTHPGPGMETWDPENPQCPMPPSSNPCWVLSQPTLHAEAWVSMGPRAAWKCGVGWELENPLRWDSCLLVKCRTQHTSQHGGTGPWGFSSPGSALSHTRTWAGLCPRMKDGLVWVLATRCRLAREMRDPWARGACLLSCFRQGPASGILPLPHGEQRGMCILSNKADHLWRDTSHLIHFGVVDPLWCGDISFNPKRTGCKFPKLLYFKHLGPCEAWLSHVWLLLCESTNKQHS